MPGSCLWAKESCTGSRSPEMLVSPTVMPTTVSSRTCPVWLTSCVGGMLPEPSRQQQALAAGGMPAVPARTLNMPSCWMLRTVTTTRAVWLLRNRNVSLGRWMWAAFPCSVAFSTLGSCGGEQRWGGCLLAVSPLCSGPSSLAPGTNPALPGWVLLSNISRSPESRRGEPHPQHPAAKGQSWEQLLGEPQPTITLWDMVPWDTQRAGDPCVGTRSHTFLLLLLVPLTTRLLLGQLLGEGSSLPSAISHDPFPSCHGSLTQPWTRVEEEHAMASPAPGRGRGGVLGRHGAFHTRERGTPHLHGGKGDEDIVGNGPADVQEQHPQAGQPVAQHRHCRLQQPAGREGCGTRGRGALSPPSPTTAALMLPEPVLPQAGAGRAVGASQLRAALGQVGAGGPVTSLLRLRRGAAPVVPVAPPQGCAEGSGVTVGHEAPGRGRDGGYHSLSQLSCPRAASGRRAGGEMGGKPQNLRSALPLPTGEGAGRRIWQLPGSKGAALQLCGLQKAAGLPSGLGKAKPLCLR